MKKILATLTLTAILSLGAAFAQEGDAKQDVKDAAHATADATKDAAHSVKRHTKRAYHKTKRGVKRAAHATARATKKAAEETHDAVDPK